VTGRLTVKDFLDVISQSPRGNEFLADSFGVHFEGWLLRSKLKADSSAQRMIAQYREQFKGQESTVAQRARSIVSVADDPTFNEYMWGSILKKIEVSGRFQDV
jgi:hypothetical protein